MKCCPKITIFFKHQKLFKISENKILKHDKTLNLKNLINFLISYAINVETKYAVKNVVKEYQIFQTNLNIYSIKMYGLKSKYQKTTSSDFSQKV